MGKKAPKKSENITIQSALGISDKRMAEIDAFGKKLDGETETYAAFLKRVGKEKSLSMNEKLFMAYKLGVARGASVPVLPLGILGLLKSRM